jgi:vacuolar-type H+-ATPase subunit B/Vma2
MKTLSAHVVKVAEDGASLEVDFKHPATEEVRHLTFFVDNQTGLSKIEKLQDLRSGQVVSIDYVEGEKGRLLIRRIARVKLSGPPAGLEKFRGL